LDTALAKSFFQRILEFKMRTKTIAVCFDNTKRPETTGTYCLTALHECATVRHVLPSDLGTLSSQQFDLYFRIDDGLDYQLPPQLRPSTFWAIDTHVGFDRCLAQARTCDLVFAAQRDGAERLERAGIANASWLPLACDPAIHRKHDVSKQFDVAFVGNLFDGPRADLLDVIQRRYRNSFVGRCYFEEMARTYSAARTVFNRSICNDVNMRVFEALACGSLLVTNDLTDNGQADFFRDGTHLATYRDADELLDKIDFYLKHPDTRAKVESAGMREVIEKHTYRHRMATILAAAEKLPTTAPVASPNPIPTAYDPGYFEFDRPELLALVPPTARDILDVGCGAGRFGATLKARQPCRVTGLELDPAAASAARSRLDAVHEGDLETLTPPFAEAAFDAIVCGDVLEHLREPLAFLRRSRIWLRPGGTLVASVPNVRHHTVVRSLLSGNWTYEPAGLLDRTHLRFFTRRETEKLFHRAGFAVEGMAFVPGPDHAAWVAEGRPNMVKVGRLHIGGLPPAEAEEFHAYQFLVTAKPADRPDYGLISIVILTHNQLHYTRRCVDSICLVTDEPYELIFVDNGSTDGTLEYLRALAATHPNVKVIANAENCGFPAGCNQGIAVATGRQVLLLNNDTVVATGWLGRLLRALHSDPKIGLAGPVSDNVSGEQQVPAHFDGIEDLDGFAWDWGKSHDGQIFDNDRLVGFCLLIKREVIDRIGLLDEQFGTGCFEDDDYTRRARMAEFRTVIAADAFIHHVGGATFRASNVDFAALMRTNEQKFRDKWERPPPAEDAADVPMTYVLKAGPAGGLLLERVPDWSRALRSAVPRVQPILSMCMIVRNNSRTIRAALKSIAPYVGEMIVVDTGSTDDTVKICLEMGAKVFHFPWCDDFSAARNESIRHATGKWIFWMDSDDTIDEANGRALREWALGPHDPSVFGYVVQVYHPGRSGLPEDMNVVDHVKLFRNRPDLRFEFPLHEQILAPIRRAGGRVAWTPLFVNHSGYDRSPEGQQRKIERDLRILHQWLKKEPDHPFVLFNLGMTYADIHENAQAIEWLRQCIAVSEPDQTHVRKAYAWLVGCLSALRRPDDALRECEAGLRLTPLDDELRSLRGRLLYDAGRWAEAISVYEDLLAKEESRHFSSVSPGLRGFRTRQNLGAVREALRDWPGAEKDYRAVVAEAPKYRAGWRSLWTLLLKADQVAAAEALLTPLRSEANVQGEWAVLATALAQRAGNPVAAERALTEAFQQFPDDVEVLTELSRIYFEHFDAKQAGPFLQRLVELVPHDPSAWHNLGVVQMLQGHPEQAVTAFQESLRHGPDFPGSWVLLGSALRQCGRIPEAVQAWRRTLELEPTNAEARSQLQQLGHW
jgi:GT2 family glycosyltransferase/tetratricopeptide (TPR) repeat protein/SAM-dependent methyltransferase